MLNLLHIILVSRIYRPEPSAASFFLGAIVDSLLDEGHNVTVITAKPPQHLADATVQRPGRENVRTFPVLRDKSGYVRGYLQYLSFDIPLLFRLLFTPKPDVVFVEPPPTTGAVVRLVCSLRRIPYVYDAADIWSDAASHATGSRLVVRALRAVERFAIRGAAHIVTISKQVIDRLDELGVQRPATVTGFGADTTSFKYVHAEVEPLFVYAGSYSAWHGAEVLIESFAKLLETHPNFKLRFIGNGTERDRLKTAAKELSIEQSVDFHDPIAASELLPVISSATATLATLLPGSGYDYAFTTKAYSSLASGCPVIFAGPGPTIDFIESANQSVQAGAAVEFDADLIASAMRGIADNPPTPAARKKTAEWTKNHHSIDSVSLRVRDVLTSFR